MRIAALAASFAMSASIGVGAAAALTLTSPDIRPGGRIAEEQALNGFDCAGGNLSPALAWSGAPAGAKSFAVSMLDLDAPSGGFWHWWVADIPPTVASLAKGAGAGPGLPGGAGAGPGLPGGAVEWSNDFGLAGYGGPCPPSGKPHRYLLTVYALDVARLHVAAGASPAVVAASVRAHTLAQAALTGLYGR